MDVQLGQVFGGYRLTRRIGGGQLGQVYEAQQERTERWVALRLVDKMLTYGTEAQRRLLEGLKGVNRLALPALVSYQDWGVTKDGQVYLVMERLTGMPLPEWLASRGCLPPHEAGKLLLEVAAGLAQAHQQGLRHVALDAGKLLVVADPFGPGGGRLRLRDLGFVRAMAQDEEAKEDVLALGRCLFLMVAGQPPPSDSSERQQLLRERNLPKGLEFLFERVLEADAERRAPMDTLLKGLRELASGGAPSLPAPAATPRPTTPREPLAKRLLQRHRGELMMALGGLALLSGGLLHLREGEPTGPAPRLVVSSDTAGFCRGLALPAPGPPPPEAFRAVAEQLSLAFHGGRCFQPAFLGKAELIDQDRVNVRGALDVGGIAFRPDGRLALAMGSGKAEDLQVRELTTDGRLGPVLVDMDYIPLVEQEEDDARFSAGPLAFDAQGSALLAIHRRTAKGKRSVDLYWGRQTPGTADDHTVQKLAILPQDTRSLLTPGFDRDWLYVGAGTSVYRYARAVGTTLPERPWLAVEGRALRAALPLAPDRALLVLAGSGDLDAAGAPRALTVLMDTTRRGFYLVTEEDIGLLARSFDGQRLMRYNPRQRVLTRFQLIMP